MDRQEERQLRRAVTTGVSLALLRAFVWLGVLAVLGVAGLWAAWVILRPV